MPTFARLTAGLSEFGVVAVDEWRLVIVGQVDHEVRAGCLIGRQRIADNRAVQYEIVAEWTLKILINHLILLELLGHTLSVGANFARTAPGAFSSRHTGYVVAVLFGGRYATHELGTNVSSVILKESNNKKISQLQTTTKGQIKKNDYVTERRILVVNYFALFVGVRHSYSVHMKHQREAGRQH